jgi:Acyl-protein synthetase, LuxE
LVPNSSLAHMFETVQRRMGCGEPVFLGTIGSTGEWTIDFEAAMAALRRLSAENRPVLLLGTAFSYVHLVDFLTARGIRLELPGGSRALETGGYKGRSRSVPKTELYSMLNNCLGIEPENIVGEYGMSELSSQAYNRISHPHPGSFPEGEGERFGSHGQGAATSRPVFSFPPWARVRVISPETGEESVPGEAGLLQVFDLANVFSVMAVQTADVAVRDQGGGFELLGRAASAEPRGCSLMAK